MKSEVRDWIENKREDIIRDVIQLVKIPSVSEKGKSNSPFGTECRRVLVKMLSLASQYGLSVENHEDYCGSAILKGKSDKEIGIFSHLDVVPEGVGWELLNPYEPMVKDGWIYGRGSADNKGPAVAALYAIRYFNDHNITLKHTLRQFYGCDEERGMEDIKYFLTKHQEPSFSLVPDAAFPVCCGEKGRIGISFLTEFSEDIINLSGGEGKNIVPKEASACMKGYEVSLHQTMDNITISKEEGVARVNATGIAGHAGKPEGTQNAIGILVGFLSACNILRKSDQRKFEFLNEIFCDIYGERLGIACEDDNFGKLTVVGTLLSMNNRTAQLYLDIRYPVSASGEKILKKLIERAAIYGFSYTLEEDNKGYYLEEDDPIVRKLTKICEEVYHRDLKPYCMGGGTYARKLTNAVGYGPGLSFQKKPCKEGHGKGHQPDECICIDNLINAIEIYIRAIEYLDEHLER